MSRLTWIQRGHGWLAGPYEIELAAPQLWVCTRRRGGGRATVEMTSGSLNALMGRVEKLEHRRRSTRRLLVFAMGFLVSMLAVGLAAVIDAGMAPFLAISFATLGLWSLLKAVDCMIRRSWESLNLNYQ